MAIESTLLENIFGTVLALTMFLLFGTGILFTFNADGPRIVTLAEDLQLSASALSDSSSITATRQLPSFENDTSIKISKKGSNTLVFTYDDFSISRNYFGSTIEVNQEDNAVTLSP